MDLNKRKADRLRVMNEFFDVASGSERVIIGTEAVCTQLGLSDQEWLMPVAILKARGSSGRCLDCGVVRSPIGFS